MRHPGVRHGLQTLGEIFLIEIGLWRLSSMRWQL